MKYVYCVDMENGECLFINRDLVENPNYRLGKSHRVRQLIPYIVLVSSDHEKVAVFQRIKGDARLKGGLIIGVGGHVEPTDLYGKKKDDPLFSAAYRELEEELGISTPSSLTQTNITICSDDTPVDSVHYGDVFLAETSSSFICQDGELEFVGWKTFKELAGMELESWSMKIRKDVEKWISRKS